MKIKKTITKDDLGENPKPSGKRLKTRPPLSSARILPKGLHGSELRGFK